MQGLTDLEKSPSSGIIGDPLGDYDSSFTDIEIVSSSGYNLVCRAKRYGRLWLLKGLAEKFRNEPIYRTMLRKEFDLMMHLHDSHIALASSLEYVPGIGECIVMEYIDGVSLREWLMQDVTLGRKQYVARQLIEAVRYVHLCGIVHRDLKPENIMITRNGDNVKLIDFGLSDSDSYDILKQAAGTPGYISPEQRINPEADIRNDIYSLGCVLRDINPGRNFNSIARRCLLPADRRFSSIAELTDRLEALEKRNKIYLAVSSAIVVLVLTFISIFSVARLEKITSENSKTIDSLSNSLSSSVNVRKLQSDTIRQLTDSVANLSLSLSSSRQRFSTLDSIRASQENHSAAIERIVADGKKIVDDKWASVIAHCDEKNAVSAEDYKDYYGAIDAYMGSLKYDLTSVEKDNIRQILLLYSGKNIQKWNQKLLNMQ